MAVQIYPAKIAAEMLGITPKALAARARRGAMSAQKIGGRWTVAFDPADLPELRKGHPTK